MTAEAQRANVRSAAPSLASVAAEHQLVLSHGNGPQVGLLALQAAAYTEVVAMVDVLGLSPGDFATASADGGLRAAVDALVPAMLEARQAARERKDYAEADRVRDALAAAGVVVEDTASGPRWRLG